MKKILVTQRIAENDTYYEVRDMLDVNWGKMLQQIRCIPILFPSECSVESYFNECGIDGVLFTGGNDLFSCNPSSINKRRDNLEINILKYAISNNIPVVGVCRGMQLIGEYFGMKLEKVEDHIGSRHEIVWINWKAVSDVPNYTKVNSYHQYAFKEVSDNIIPLARTSEGIIEMIKHKGYSIYGLMWHPERDNEEYANLLDDLFSGKINMLGEEYE